MSEESFLYNSLIKVFEVFVQTLGDDDVNPLYQDYDMVKSAKTDLSSMINRKM